METQQIEVIKPRRTLNSQRYERVNKAWPTDIQKLTAPEAETIAKRLWKYATGGKFKWRYKIMFVTGNRYTKFQLGTLRINLAPHHTTHNHQAWNHLIHAISHKAHDLVARREHRGHGMSHAAFEHDLVQHVLGSGWTDGRFRKAEKPKPTLDAKRAKKLANAKARLKAWQTKQKRAETAIKKLTQQIKRTEKVLGAA